MVRKFRRTRRKRGGSGGLSGTTKMGTTTEGYGCKKSIDCVEGLICSGGWKRQDGAKECMKPATVDGGRRRRRRRRTKKKRRRRKKRSRRRRK